MLTTQQYASRLEPLASKANIEMHLLEGLKVDNSRHQASQTLAVLAETAAVGSSEAEVQKLLVQHLDELNHAEDDGALIVYTSGTTGKPKGTLVTVTVVVADMF